jgi:hypothetical protein
MNAATLSRFSSANPSAIGFDDGQIGRILGSLDQSRRIPFISQRRQFHPHLVRYALYGTR